MFLPETHTSLSSIERSLPEAGPFPPGISKNPLFPQVVPLQKHVEGW